MTENRAGLFANVLRHPRQTINQSLSWKLGSIVGGMTVALLISSGIALFALYQFISAGEARSRAQDQSRLAFQIRSDVQSYTAALLDMVWTHIDRAADLERHSQSFAADIASARQRPEGPPGSRAQPDQLALLDQLAAQQQTFEVLAEDMVSLSQSGRDREVAIEWIRGKNMADATASLADDYYQAQDSQAVAAQAAADGRRTIATILLISTLILALTLGVSITVVLSRRIVAELHTLTDAAQRVANQEIVELPISSQDERATFARTFNTMVADLATQRETLRHWSEELEQNVAERTRELQEALRRQEELTSTIRHMSTPVLPVLKGMLVVPLVGVLDDDRMRQMQAILLQAVVNYHANTAILDITGMPIIDESVARSLVETVQQVGLLGARCLIVGVSPDVAQSLVALGDHLGQIQTLSNLQTAVAAAIRQR
jgi:anti-anti-sigma regulatory factor